MSTLLGSPAPDFMYINASAPDAPPLSETTIGCFIRLFFWIAACIIRAIWSEAPPAPAATTISTGLIGSHAAAGAAVSMSASAEAAHKQIRGRILAMAFSSIFASGPSASRRGSIAEPRHRPDLLTRHPRDQRNSVRHDAPFRPSPQDVQHR